ncbi:MAG: hypothetical protein D6785_15590, partial [Planctomycetota bacterium]
LAKILELIHTPTKAFPDLTSRQTSRIRAMALKKLLFLDSKKAKKAYLEILSIQTRQEILLPALSTLLLLKNQKQKQDKWKEALKKLMLQGKDKEVRKKASQVYAILFEK